MRNKRLEHGTVHVYTGDGKGKTTAALGQAFRSIGHNFKVMMIMFMKGNVEYGELESARRLAPFFEIREMGRESFVSKENPEAIDIQWAEDGIKLARKVLQEGKHDLVILDEINVAVDYKLVDVEDVLELIRIKPSHMELILTGRNAHDKLMEVADLVTEMKLIKHYYDRGVQARVGIER